ncbi:hypothetical protein Hte_004296 [Hypoxylon texense]
MKSPNSKQDISAASQSARGAHQHPDADLDAGELEGPPPYASHDFVRPDSHPTTYDRPYVSQSRPLRGSTSDDGYAPPEPMSAEEGKRDHADACYNAVWMAGGSDFNLPRTTSL